MKTNARGITTLVLAMVALLTVDMKLAVAAEDESPPSSIAEPDNASAERPQAENGDGLRLNFRGARLESVLDYLSEAAGFIIVLDAEIDDRVDVWSHQPLTKDEAVNLLNTVLNENGYAAIRNGRTLTIVDREEARLRDLPVRTGSDPEGIPKTDEMITQIISVRYADAVQLLEDLSPLIPDYATVSANESSNAIVLTDTQTNVRRMAEIVQALDTSISSISGIRVFALSFAEAEDVAEVITKIFEADESEQNQGRGDPRQAFARMMRGGRGGGGSAPDEASDSEARRAASRVVAVSDERTNSLVVSAPEEFMPTIETLVEEIDTEAEDPTEIRVFRLRNADAYEMVDIITELFPDENQNSQDDQRARFGRGGSFGRGGPGGGGGGGGQTDERTMMDYSVMAVADPRTKSVIVSAAHQQMGMIAEMIEKLDSDPAKKQKVFVYRLENADVENVAEILRGMFEDESSGNRTTTSSQFRNNLNNASSSGAGTGTTSGFGGFGDSQTNR